MSLKLGTDVEVLLQTANGDFVSSIGLIGGSKEEPLLVDGGNLQEDNVLAEFAVDPSNTKEGWREGIEKVYGLLQHKVKEYDLTTVIKASAHYPDKELEHPMAMVFGCTPDSNAYTLQHNTPPDPDTVGTLRSCGGHIHVSLEEVTKDEDEKAAFIRILDLLLGVPSVLMDADVERRNLYGKAGAYRSKEYGVEYRTLSNFWIQSKAHIDWAYDQVEAAMDRYLGGFRITPDIGDKVIECINNGDSSLAKELIKAHKLEVV